MSHSRRASSIKGMEESSVWHCITSQNNRFNSKLCSRTTTATTMSNNKRIVTLWDRKNSEDTEDHEHPHPDASQAFYAGGSEHSGQQILGPNRDGPESSRLIENLFNHARQSAALVSDPNDPAQQSAPGSSTLPITFYHNGFTVGSDGELRDYQAPENRQFLECLRRGETPPELANRVQRGVIDVKLDNKAHIDYKPEKKIQAFTGQGHRLGAPAPETETANEQQAQQSQQPTASSSSLVVDDSKPSTTIQIRLVDNSRVVVRINLSSNVGDLVSHLRAIRPQYSTTNFVLATTFPAKELTNLDETISEAKLANASVLQKIKR